MKYIAVPLMLILVACGGSNDHAHHTSTPSEVNVPQPMPSDPVSKLLAAYYSLKESLVEADSSAADNAAVHLGGLADSTEALALVNDSTKEKIAENLLDSISITTAQLIKASDLTGRRRSFSQLGSYMLALLQQTDYSASTVYIQECPMAFNDTETASWLSNAAEIVNPYLGKKHPKYSAGMLHCGELKDSIPSKP